MKTFKRTSVLASIAMLLLLGGSSAAFANTSQSFTLSGTGGVTNLGSQTYTVSGGLVAYAEVDGATLNPGASIQYNFVATQNGPTTTSVSGYGSMRLTGYAPGLGEVKATTSFVIAAIEGAIVDPTTGAQIPIGNNQLPAYFISISPTTITIDGQNQYDNNPMLIESPYLNPWGLPIVMGTTDGDVVVAATYNVGTIDWQGTQVQALLSGNLGSSSVSSAVLTLTSNENENLVAGSAVDSGTMSLAGLTSSTITGSYFGTDYIPWAGATDCSSSTPFLIPGTCTETGFQSQGEFSGTGASGTYNTQWGVPALGFYTTIHGSISQGRSSGYSGGSGFFGFLGLLSHI